MILDIESYIWQSRKMFPASDATYGEALKRSFAKDLEMLQLISVIGWLDELEVIKRLEGQPPPDSSWMKNRPIELALCSSANLFPEIISLNHKTHIVYDLSLTDLYQQFQTILILAQSQQPSCEDDNSPLSELYFTMRALDSILCDDYILADEYMMKAYRQGLKNKIDKQGFPAVHTVATKLSYYMSLFTIYHESGHIALAHSRSSLFIHHEAFLTAYNRAVSFFNEMKEYRPCMGHEQYSVLKQDFVPGDYDAFLSAAQNALHGDEHLINEILCDCHAATVLMDFRLPTEPTWIQEYSLPLAPLWALSLLRDIDFMYNRLNPQTGNDVLLRSTVLQSYIYNILPDNHPLRLHYRHREDQFGYQVLMQNSGVFQQLKRLKKEDAEYLKRYRACNRQDRPKKQQEMKDLIYEHFGFKN